jgi:uncharacterized protein YggE
MPPQTEKTTDVPPKKKLKLPHGLKALTYLLSIVVIVLILTIVLFWKPWQPNVKASDRVITVTGEATMTATPDEYVFTPTYDFTDTEQSTALAQLTTTSNQIVSKLKSLSVASSAIQTSSNGYSSGNYVPVTQDNGQTTYELDLTVTIDNATLAQKVQDYLVTTNPTGDVSPTVNFSVAMENSLKNKARNEAEQDARANAEQSAKNLGFKIASVKTVVDGGLGSNENPSPCGGVIDSNGPAICAGTNLDTASGSSSSSPSLDLQPGQNQLYYSVQVQYYIH